MIYQSIFEHKLQKLAKYQFPKKVREKSCHFASWGVHTQKSKLKLKSIKIQFCMSCCWWKLHIERLSVMFSLPSDFYKIQGLLHSQVLFAKQGVIKFQNFFVLKKRNIKWKDCLTLRDFVLKQRQIGDEIMIGKLVGFKSIEKKNGRLEIWFSEWIFLKKVGFHFHTGEFGLVEDFFSIHFIMDKLPWFSNLQSKSSIVIDHWGGHRGLSQFIVEQLLFSW